MTTPNPFLRIDVTLHEDQPWTPPSSSTDPFDPVDPLDPCDICDELVPRSLLSCDAEGNALCESCDAEATEEYTSVHAAPPSPERQPERLVVWEAELSQSAMAPVELLDAMGQEALDDLAAALAHELSLHIPEVARPLLQDAGLPLEAVRLLLPAFSNARLR